MEKRELLGFYSNFYGNMVNHVGRQFAAEIMQKANDRQKEELIFYSRRIARILEEIK